MAQRRCRCRRIGNSRFVDRRPDHPVTGYNLFVRQFYLDNFRGRVKSFRECTGMIREAAMAWHGLPHLSRQSYETTGHQAQCAYRAKLSIWNRKRQVLKRPPNPYILFYLDFYKKSCQGQAMIRASRRASDCWNNMGESDKQPYVRRYRAMYRTFQRNMAALRNGTTTIDALTG